MILQGMFGSGRVLSGKLTLKEARVIVHPLRKRMDAVLFAVARGSTPQSGCVRLLATGTAQLTETIVLVFVFLACPGLIKPLFFYLARSAAFDWFGVSI